MYEGPPPQAAPSVPNHHKGRFASVSESTTGTLWLPVPNFMKMHCVVCIRDPKLCWGHPLMSKNGNCLRLNKTHTWQPAYTEAYTIYRLHISTTALAYDIPRPPVGPQGAGGESRVLGHGRRVGRLAA